MTQQTAGLHNDQKNTSSSLSYSSLMFVQFSAMRQNKNKVRQSRLSADTPMARFHFFHFLFFFCLSANRLRAMFSHRLAFTSLDDRLQAGTRGVTAAPACAAGGRRLLLPVDIMQRSSRLPLRGRANTVFSPSSYSSSLPPPSLTMATHHALPIPSRSSQP